MLSSNNIKNILTGLFNKNKEEHDKDINHLKTNMNKGWISSGTIEQLHGVSDTSAPFDYYSEEEQLVGQWVDGKPLYRKVIFCKSPSTANTRLYYENTIPNLDQGVNIWGFLKYGTDTSYTIPLLYPRASTVLYNINFAPAKNGFGIYFIDTDVNVFNKDCFIVAEYTKTTDTSIDKKEIVANGINMQLYDGTHYSEDELLIGQWIDGKPLYRKVFNLPDNFTVSTSWKYAENSINNVDQLVSGSVLRINKSTGQTDALNMLMVNVNNAKLNLYSSATITIENGYIVLEYTKTTDTPYSIDEDIAWVALESDVNDVLNNIGE